MRKQLAVVALAAASLTLAGAQVEQALERRVEGERVREQRKLVEGDATLEEGLRTRILERYDEAISAVEAEQAAQGRAARFEKELAGVDSAVEALQVTLNQPQREPVLNLPENPTTEQAEVELARQRSRLDANRTGLRTAEQAGTTLTNRRNEISKRLGILDQLVENLNDQLQTPPQDAPPRLMDAIDRSLRARRQSARQEIETLRAELALLDKRSALVPLQVDLARRSVAYRDQMVALADEAAAEIRVKEAAASLEEVRNLALESTERVPGLADLAAETEDFARMLWAPDGVLNQSAVAAKTLTNARKHQADLDRITQLIRRQFTAYGHRGSASRWWPKVPDDYPETGDVAAYFSEVQRTIPEAQHQLIRLEESRAESNDLRTRTLQAVQDMSVTRSVQSERTAETLLSRHQDLLDRLTQAYGRYSTQLIEIETLLESFLEEQQAAESFLFERLLWVRSVPRPIVPPLAVLASAFLSYFSGQSWSGFFGAIGDGFGSLPGKGVGTVLALALLLWFRRWMLRRLDRLAGLVRDPAADALRHTFEAVGHTILLAAPGPLVLSALSLALVRSDPTPFLFAGGRAFGYLAAVVGVFELWRQVLRPNGLGEAHFGWMQKLARQAYRGLLLPELLFLAPLFIALHCSFIGMRLSSPIEMQAVNNSLGRGAFIAAMAVFGLPLLNVFRPGRELLERKHFPRWQRLYVYTYPFILIGILLPATLAVVGFYMTGYLLAFQTLRMLWLVAGLVLLSGLLARWHVTGARSRLAQPGMGISSGQEQLTEADAQVRKLFRFVVILVAAFGLYGVWSQALPALQIMKQIQIWPEFAMMDPAGGVAPDVAESARAAAPSAPTEGEGASAPAFPGVPGGASPSTEDQGQDSSALTLWSIFQALLAGVITVVLVKNIPGVLALTLRTRTKLDSGARVAFTTLIRYVIMIVGVTATFSLLGITWSKVQWLAAALTFGLGFGLQEIVANFVSGLILLLERPVRVGDAVTISNLQGRVTRIQLRATTITLWDRSEMIVPNKEFITGKLVNWTLSDSKRRIDIPLRVAYGANVQEVKQVLLDVARQNPAVLDDPGPMALLEEFGEDALKFELRFFVDFGRGIQTKQELHEAVERAFRQKGISFALPRLDIQVGDGQQPRSGKETVRSAAAKPAPEPDSTR